jgi:hypothetical protein
MTSVAVRDPGPMARLAGVKADADAPAEVFRLLTDADQPKTLDEIAKLWALPRGRFVEWFTTEHAGTYDAALKVLGASLGHKVLELTNAATADTVKLLKFQTDRYLRLAAHWDGARYSPKVEHKHSGVMPVLVIEIAGDEAPAARVIEAEDVDVLPEKAQTAAGLII